MAIAYFDGNFGGAHRHVLHRLAEYVSIKERFSLCLAIDFDEIGRLGVSLAAAYDHDGTTACVVPTTATLWLPLINFLIALGVISELEQCRFDV
mmetsp:Transcript_7069/g.9846  ORF Transcript_7069/g.9846 Transcript_7069/m.9846 type:complete len:94 (-) Transcript_7069:1500-1781(-)|eukprot:CAMPEP_0185592924 /NCGR_PEP_ID=MMETSP0434-20130131/69681_1 /TAXON_ID=626734 ORGANISM="Favella taraikaensis, Strain Fe Narragansett Bay" /NCGR_SAMPLE_ID=MMETSP0434 /ASSEMBLY_ACC=CAM_ASM_000379 /LENGTH=93 /DNA_ID=CAMNT_0028219111 /DNA_START=805 /DNA_END=1086 /DNA_ORIENTATION=-